MAVLEIVITITLAIIIGALFYYAFRSRGPWGSFWSFFLILLLGGIAAEAWMEPIGPQYWNISWVPTIIVMIVLALILAAATPTQRESAKGKSTRAPTRNTPNKREVAAVAFGGFFWLLTLILLVVAIWGIFA